MRRPLVAFLVLLSVAPCQAVTIMKNVGHGDCYVVVADGRTVVVDLGPSGSGEGLVALLRAGQFHFDRIVVTHVHADHVGGLLTAARYAALQGSALTAEKLVSNHGTHDLNLITREPQLRHLLATMREATVVGLTDAALDELAFRDPHVTVEAFALQDPRARRRQSSENRAGLVVKVTEIRDGKRRAVLFLGDMEKAQQARLFADPRLRDIFRDVGAVTLPHHGRTTTLHGRFLDRVREFAGRDVVLLHSDQRPLDPSIAKKAAKKGIRVESTAARASDVALNLFGGEAIHCVADGGPRSLDELVREQGRRLLEASDMEMAEVVNAVARFTGRPATALLPEGTMISWPTEAWIRTAVQAQRQAENDRLLVELASQRGPEFDILRDRIAGRPGITDAQRERLRQATEIETKRRDREYHDETERLIALLASGRKAECQQAASKMAERVARADPTQVDRIQRGMDEAVRRSWLGRPDALALRTALVARMAELNAAKAERLIADLRSKNLAAREAAAEGLSQMGATLEQVYIDRIVQIMRSDGDYIEARSWRGAHCTHYEHRAGKYYAGRALEAMKSAQVSAEMRREAKVAQTEGSSHKRIDDPGWT